MKLERTITSIFMIPFLKIDKAFKEAMRFDKNVNFLNAYSWNKLRDKNPVNAIFLLFKPKDANKLKEYLVREYNRKDTTIVDDYEFTGGFVIAVYVLDNSFKKDFDLIRKGRYSKTSSEFQNLIPKMVKRTPFSQEELSLQYRIFNKTEDLIRFWEDQFDMEFDKEQEVWGGFMEEKETLNIDKIKAYL